MSRRYLIEPIVEHETRAPLEFVTVRTQLERLVLHLQGAAGGGEGPDSALTCVFEAARFSGSDNQDSRFGDLDLEITFVEPKGDVRKAPLQMANGSTIEEHALFCFPRRSPSGSAAAEEYGQDKSEGS